MSRKHSNFSLELLEFLKKRGKMHMLSLAQNYQGLKRKKVYDVLYRLIQQGYVERHVVGKQTQISITGTGDRLLHSQNFKKDGVWKMVIFDIPEKHRRVRNLLRSKLIQLGFKKWQNSIWISPFEIHAEIEKELNELSQNFFIRLVRIKSINNTGDLDKMFSDK